MATFMIGSSSYQTRESSALEPDEAVGLLGRSPATACATESAYTVRVHIAIDIDDTITYAPELFSLLVGSLREAEIIIVSFRTDRENALLALREHEIRWDRVILANDPEHGAREGQTLVDWKVGVVNQLSPAWFFEDMPEVVSRIKPHIKVFMPCDEVIREFLREATE